MRKLQILMPMAGLGSRFAEAGVKTPKPLIEIDGRPMFLKALSSLDSIKAGKTYWFVVRREQAKQHNLDKLIKTALPQANVIVIPKMTRGAAETALAANDRLDPDAGLVVMDCDLWFSSPGYNKMIEDSLAGNSNIAGGLLTFDSNNPRYSYAKMDNNNLVTETAEKRVISNHAITGAYFFASAKHFSSAAAKLLEQPISDKMPEYYMSLLYNVLIDEGKDIQAAAVGQYASFGTPEELASYQNGQQTS